MMKKIILASAGLFITSLGLNAQTWNGSTVSTLTTGNNVTIGISPQDNTSGLRVNSNQNNTSTAVRGIFNTGIFNTTANSYGIYNYSYNTSSGTNYGVYSLMHGSYGTGARYAIYGEATTGLANSWAGYFKGHGYFQGNLGVGVASPAVKFEVLGGDSRFDSNGKLYIPSTGDSYFWKGTDGINNVKLSVWDKFTIYNPTTAGLNTNNADWNIQIGARDGSINTKGGATFALNGGGVGIGVSSPVSNLHISNANYAAIYMGNNAATGHHITHESGDNSFNIWAGAFGSGVNKFRINADGNMALLNGNVGIGTVTPQAKLDVQGSTVVRGGITTFEDTWGGTMVIGQNNSILTSPGTSPNLTIGVPPASWNPNGCVFMDVKGNDANPNNALYINTWSGRNTYINCNSWGANVPNNGGKVYLGVTRIGARNPIAPHEDALLSVDGKVLVTSIYVNTTSWPDYVFADNYQLPKLSEIEAFYKEYKHLPEIPSEKEVLENGINVAEMNLLLLKKVEELTLHIVELQKQIDELKK